MSAGGPRLPGWVVFGEAACYFERGLTPALCEETATRFPSQGGRALDVARDLGRVALCEACKAALRERGT